MRAPDPSPRNRHSRAVFFQVFPSVMLPMFLAMLDQTIVATALPAIAGSVGGVERVSWVVVSDLIATTVAAPVDGRLGDLLGRRRLSSCRLSSTRQQWVAALEIKGDDDNVTRPAGDFQGPAAPAFNELRSLARPKALHHSEHDVVLQIIRLKLHAFIVNDPLPRLWRD